MNNKVNDRQIKIFLSSTFSDMQEERNHLIKKVFPRIKAECTKRGVDFSVIDLRWGVTEEESKNGKVIEICLDEIQRARPFFVGLLGGRYGWIPNESECNSNKRLKEKYPCVYDFIKERLSVTEMEIRFGVLSSESQCALFYIRNDSHIPKKLREKDPRKALRLKELKENIKNAAKHGTCCAEEYTTINSLGDMLYSTLMGEIDSRYPLETNSEQLIDISQEIFETNLRKVYKRSHSVLEFNHLWDLDSNYLIIGASGSGKSAFVANWNTEENKEYGIEGLWIKSEKGDCEDDVFVPIIRTYINSHLNTCQSCLKNREKQVYSKLGGNYDGPTIWMLDGLENLVDFNEFVILTNNLPAKITLIATTADDAVTNCLGAMRKIELPPLQVNDIQKITEIYLAEYSKRLSEQQRIHISNCPLFAKPSMLILFLDELLQFGIYEQLDTYIDSLLKADDEYKFVNYIIEQTEKDYGIKISDALSLLSTVQNGLPEEGIRHSIGVNALDWASIYIAIKPFIYDIENHIILKKNFRNILSHRYSEQINIVSHKAINIIENENSKLRKIIRKEYGFLASTLLLKNFPTHSLTGGYVSYLSRNNSVELIMLYQKTGQWKKIFNFAKSPFGLMDYIVGELPDAHSVLEELYENGFRPMKAQFSPRNINALYYFIEMAASNTGEAFLQQMVTFYRSFEFIPEEFRYDEIITFTKNIALSLLVPLDLRNKVIEKIISFMDNTSSDEISVESDSSIMITPECISQLSSRVITMVDVEEVEAIIKKAKQLVSTCNKDDPFYLELTTLIAICNCRLGNREEARGEIDYLNSFVPHTGLVPIEVLYTLLCDKHYGEKRMSQWLEFLEESNTGHPLFEIYSYTWEKLHSVDADINDYLQLICEYFEDDGNGDITKALVSFANWLTIMEWRKPTAATFIKISEIAEDNSLKADAIFNAGALLREAMDYEKSAECFKMAVILYGYASDENAAVIVESEYYCTQMLYASGKYVEAYEYAQKVLTGDRIRNTEYYGLLLDIVASYWCQCLMRGNPREKGIYLSRALEAGEAATKCTYADEEEYFSIVSSFLKIITGNIKSVNKYYLEYASQLNCKMLTNCSTYSYETYYRNQVSIIAALEKLDSQDAIEEIEKSFISPNLNNTQDIQHFISSVVCSYLRPNNNLNLKKLDEAITNVRECIRIFSIENFITLTKSDCPYRKDAYTILWFYYSLVAHDISLAEHFENKVKELAEDATDIGNYVCLSFNLKGKQIDGSETYKEIFNALENSFPEFPVSRVIRELYGANSLEYGDDFFLVLNSALNRFENVAEEIYRIITIIDYIYLPYLLNDIYPHIITHSYDIINELGLTLREYTLSRLYNCICTYPPMDIERTEEYRQIFYKCNLPIVLPVTKQDTSETALQKYILIMQSTLPISNKIEANYQVQEMLVSSGQYDSALNIHKEYAKLREQCDDNEILLSNDARQHLIKAYCLMNLGNYDDAQMIFYSCRCQGNHAFYDSETSIISLASECLCATYCEKFMDIYDIISSYTTDYHLEASPNHSDICQDMLEIIRAIINIRQGILTDAFRIFDSAMRHYYIFYQDSEALRSECVSKYISTDDTCGWITVLISLYHIELANYYIKSEDIFKAVTEKELATSFMTGRLAGIFDVELFKLERKFTTTN